jgi:GT2 family glycosyltransferase
MDQIICVIVTYNRLQLLKESIAAVKSQTRPVDRIIVVDNHSTDGTADYLGTLAQEPLFQIVTMKENVGGSGGFAEGIRKAALQHADWIWLMDDDTIPTPDALERMLPFTQDAKVGFVNSLVLWTDGTPHLMNGVKKIKNMAKAQHALADSTGVRPEDIEMISMASFVSLLVRGDIPWKLGLPYKEFFIWCDDSEYTERICKSGYCGVRTRESIVVHKTPINCGPSLSTLPVSVAWKAYYGVRNESFLRRKRKGWLLFFFAQLNCFRTHARRIKARKLPTEDETKLLRENNRGLWDGFTFNPQIEYIKND